MQIIDVATLNADLSTEDQEIMQMFRNRKRVSGADSMLMINRNDETILVSKKVIKDHDRLMHRIFRAANVAVAGFSLCVGLSSLITGVGHPVPWLVLFELSCVPVYIKFINKIVQEGPNG